MSDNSQAGEPKFTSTNNPWAGYGEDRNSAKAVTGDLRLHGSLRLAVADLSDAADIRVLKSIGTDGNIPEIPEGHEKHLNTVSLNP